MADESSHGVTIPLEATTIVLVTIFFMIMLTRSSERIFNPMRYTDVTEP